MAKVILGKGKDKRVRQGHPWIYDNEVEEIKGEFKDGEVVDVLSYKDAFIGRGYINPASKILVRMLTYEQEEINHDFFKRRIQQAWDYRCMLTSASSYRLIFAEADLLPALIVDKFEDILVVQTLALGIDIHKETIADILMDIVKPRGIYERNDVHVRELEGMQQIKGFLRDSFDTTVKINENGLQILVDIKDGQKTGYFLDQRENRAAIANICKGAKVLDCFCHTGSFSLHAARYGAHSVTGVDISEHAVEWASNNAEINGLSSICEFKALNAFDYLKELSDGKSHYDVVVLDPPAFTKSRDTINSAVRGYKEINLRALKILNPGGFLVTSSCSHHIDDELFLDIIFDAAIDAKRQVRIVEQRSQSKDHPVLLASPETKYLKFVIAQVL